MALWHYLRAWFEARFARTDDAAAREEFDRYVQEGW